MNDVILFCIAILNFFVSAENLAHYNQYNTIFKKNNKKKNILRWAYFICFILCFISGMILLLMIAGVL